MGFLPSQGLFVNVAYRVTGLAPSIDAVTGNYRQAKCVTCPGALAGGLREITLKESSAVCVTLHKAHKLKSVLRPH